MSVWDPFAGTGTFPIEALLHTMGSNFVADRNFAFEMWPSNNEFLYQQYKQAAINSSRSLHLTNEQIFYLGSDIDNKMIEYANENFLTLNYPTEQVEFMQGDFSTIAKTISVNDCKNLLVISNLPYDKRENVENLPKLLTKFNYLFSQRKEFKNVFALTSTPILLHKTAFNKLKWIKILEFRNGGLPVQLMRLLRI
eukprot:TRINITY_DN6007_c0_g1_i1.p1 TRINITY_DN6007_c0_g1~~TRINITY_DN6007_c0_g1_i1.p1  ORF type:complete len:196 (-),score=58.66 TRINITY_DN6007_c0_g1_i1:87-674(-)